MFVFCGCTKRVAKYEPQETLKSFFVLVVRKTHKEIGHLEGISRSLAVFKLFFFLISSDQTVSLFVRQPFSID